MGLMGWPVYDLEVTSRIIHSAFKVVFLDGTRRLVATINELYKQFKTNITFERIST